MRTLVFDTNIVIPPACSPNVQPGGTAKAAAHTIRLKRKAKRDMRAFGWGMVKAYAAGEHVERGRVTVTLKVCRHGEQRLTAAYPCYRPTDTDNLDAALKGLFDGFVRAGLFPNDDEAHMLHGESGFLEVATPFEEGLRVTIEELEARDDH